jgi:hypothetical protein
MNIWDIVLIVVLVVIVALAARSAFRKDKKRSCCGDASCSGCTGDCTACHQNKL